MHEIKHISYNTEIEFQHKLDKLSIEGYEVIQVLHHNRPSYSEGTQYRFVDSILVKEKTQIEGELLDQIQSDNYYHISSNVLALIVFVFFLLALLVAAYFDHLVTQIPQ